MKSSQEGHRCRCCCGRCCSRTGCRAAGPEDVADRNRQWTECGSAAQHRFCKTLKRVGTLTAAPSGTRAGFPLHFLPDDGGGIGDQRLWHPTDGRRGRGAPRDRGDPDRCRPCGASDRRRSAPGSCSRPGTPKAPASSSTVVLGASTRSSCLRSAETPSKSSLRLRSSQRWMRMPNAASAARTSSSDSSYWTLTNCTPGSVRIGAQSLSRV